eukprot:787405-Pyramimonas_sp.AAC.1
MATGTLLSMEHRASIRMLGPTLDGGDDPASGAVDDGNRRGSPPAPMGEDRVVPHGSVAGPARLPRTSSTRSLDDDDLAAPGRQPTAALRSRRARRRSSEPRPAGPARLPRT